MRFSTRVQPPVHASLVRQDSGTIGEGEHAGQTITYRLWRGYASDGYSSDYQRRPAAWIELEYGGKRRASRFGGRNADKAEAEYQKFLDAFAAQNPGAQATFPTMAAV